MIQTVYERCFANARQLRQRGYRHPAVWRIYHTICPLVPRVDFSSGPPAVPWPVSLVVVDPVQLQPTLVGRSHIPPERLEALCPLLADRDSPASVIVVRMMIRVLASLLHGVPHTECGMVAHAMLFPCL